MNDRPADDPTLLELVQTQNKILEQIAQLLTRQSSTDKVPENDTSTKTNKANTPSPIDWFTIEGQERARAWNELAEFVETIVTRYNLALEVRPCWWRHTDAIEELTALWHTRQRLYGAGAELSAGMTWQDTLQKSRDRLRDIFVSCRDSHIDMSIGTWMSNEVRQDFQRAVDDVSAPSPRGGQ